MESRRLHDNAEVRVDRQEIGEYAAMCCKSEKKSYKKSVTRLPKDSADGEAIIVRRAMKIRNGRMRAETVNM